MRNYIKSPFNELINIYVILEQAYNLNDAITLTKQEERAFFYLLNYIHSMYSSYTPFCLH